VPGVVPGAVVVAPPSEAAKPPVEAPSEGEKMAEERAKKAAAAEAAAEARNEEKHGAHSGGAHHATEKATEKAAEAEKPDPLLSAKPEKTKPKGGSSSIDDLLDGAIGGKHDAAKHEAAASAAANLPDKPSRDDVLSAMNGVKDQVKACAKGASGVAIANVTVVGKSGRVSNVEVSGITGDVGSCVARTVRKASFPKFKADNFQVKFPFRLN
jgi:outer membrane biosynthesis protein TonB